MNKPRYDVQEVADALQIAGGNAAQAARELGCSWSTVARYMRNAPRLREVQRQARIDKQAGRNTAPALNGPIYRKWQRYYQRNGV